MRKPKNSIHLTSYDDLFGLGCEQPLETGKIVNIPLNELHPFKGHPFKVLDDDKMMETVESIKNYGVLNPGLVRPRKEGGYEIVAGHRRKRGCELAQIDVMPVIIREYTDDEAVVVMVDTNIQRENLLPSEKAFAYKMKMDALKHQGVKDANGKEEETAQLVGEKAGDSGRTVQRYIRLTYLLKELLELVDNKKLSFICAVSVSYLLKEEQKWVFRCIKEKNISMTSEMAGNLKRYSKEGKLTQLAVELILSQGKKEVKKLSLSERKLRQYFPKEYSKSKMEEIIFQLLEQWKQTQ